MSGSRFLVTGGAGFIGSHMVTELLARGRPVTVLDNFETGRRSNLEGLSGDLDVVEGSVADAPSVEKAFRDVRSVIHLAALPSVTRSVEAPLESHHANVTGAAMVFDAARNAGARVTYAGSSSAYGEQEAEQKVETLREDPLSPYAATKLAGELYCRSFSRVYGLPVVITRFFNVFGPRQVADSPYSGVIAAFCHCLVHQRAPRIDGDGSQSRDFTYVSDVVDGVLLAAESSHEGCHIVNLACGKSYSVKQLFETLSEYSGVRVEPTYAPPRNGDVQHSLADVSAAERLLGFKSKVSFAEGLAKTYDWYREVES